MRPPSGSELTDSDDVRRSFAEALAQADEFYRHGRNAEVIGLVRALGTAKDPDIGARLQTIAAMARFDLGDVVGAIADLRGAARGAADASLPVQFATTFAHFLRESDFLAPTELLPYLTTLRQLASQVGDAESLASLHIAVARVEGCRGQYVASHDHIRLARSLVGKSTNTALQITIDLVDASLESQAGNLRRSQQLAATSLDRAVAGGFAKYEYAALTNLGVIALFRGQLDKARHFLERVLSPSNTLTYVKLGALDSLAQLQLRTDNLSACQSLLDRCAQVIDKDVLPARSWYDLAHQLTRCSFLEHTGDWHGVIELASATDAELARRQYRAIRTAMLCARARALARLGEAAGAEHLLAEASLVCPRASMDPLIVLEATTAVCAALGGSDATAEEHFTRAITASRSIGHDFYEWWITKQRREVTRHAEAPARTQSFDTSRVSLFLNDVTTALTAGHSIDVLAQRIVGILQSTPLASRISLESQAATEYREDTSAEFETHATGAFSIRLTGSDRIVTIGIEGAQSIDEIALMSSVRDLVQISIARTAVPAHEDGADLTLWPRAGASKGEEAIFRSPRMVELVRIAERLADTSIPVLITGETGTGKEVFARLIHEHSASKRGPFVPFNCSAVTRELVESQLFGHRRGAFTGAVDSFPGVIRAAERGTLFLDEIGDLEQVVQPKLLRFLESGEIHPVGDTRPQHVAVRIVAATNSSLEVLAKEGRFRRDLIYRIGGAQLELPPLRERKDEIPALAALFLAKSAVECNRKGVRLADNLIAALLLYDWPGNIRQLANEIRRAVALAKDGQTLTAADLAPAVTANWYARSSAGAGSPTVEIRLDQPLAKAIDELERQFIERALDSSNGRVADAAQLLGLSRKGLFLKRRRAGLVTND